MSVLKAGHDGRDQTESMIADLTLRRIFLRGYKLRCPACDLTRWYEASDISESMPCVGCLTRVQPPLSAQFHYRLNQLVAKGLDQGTMSVVVTLLFLRNLSGSSFMYVPGIEARDTKRMDVDIIGSLDGHLFLTECKDLRQGISNNTVTEVMSQLTGVIELALQIGAEMVFLSTLRPEIPAKLEQKIRALRKHHRNRVAVHVLTAGELDEGRREKPSNAPEARIASTAECTLYSLRFPAQSTGQNYGVGPTTWRQSHLILDGKRTVVLHGYVARFTSTDLILRRLWVAACESGGVAGRGSRCLFGSRTRGRS